MPLPDAAPRPLSPRDIVKSGLCIGCGSCASAGLAEGARMRWDAYGQLKPDGPKEWFGRRSAEFALTCPFSPSAANEDLIAAERFGEAPKHDVRVGRYEAAYVGHAGEDGFRNAGSSGGMVSWVAAELLRRGLVDGVAHVAPADPEREGRLFGYRISRSQEDLRAGAKSRYYPIELSGVLDEIRKVPGRYAVVGIPCFIKAVHLARREDPLLEERIAFTLGLFCGHMKSARMVESFAWQMGVREEPVGAIDYRVKDHGRPANWYRSELQLGSGRSVQEDWWHLAEGDWGSGFFQNSACDFCDDVMAETADVSFGDAWVEPYSSDGRGTNVVVVRSKAVDAMLREGLGEGRLDMKAVDGEFVAQTQAAGLRHRREGLALRLALRRRGIQPVKRVAPARGPLPFKRKLVYRMRRLISRWSHRIFAFARAFELPRLYLGWARATRSLYHRLTYSDRWTGAKN